MIVYRGSTWGGRSEPCGKPIKRNDLCGLHARAEDQRANKQAQNQVKEDIARALTERLAIPGVKFTHLGDGAFPYALFGPAVEKWWMSEKG